MLGEVTGKAPVLRPLSQRKGTMDSLHTVAPPVDATQTAIDTLNANPSVASVDANKTSGVSAIPSDAGFPSKWSLSRIGWDQVFSVNPTATSTVASLDTGVDSMHEDLAGKVIPGTSILDPMTYGTTDPNGHGTEMAGIVAASSDNGIGITGASATPASP
jgi:hypothetical protein